MSVDEPVASRDDGGGESIDSVEWANWIILAVVVGIVGIYASRFISSSGTETLVDKPAPSFELPTVESGDRVGLSEFRGRVVVLDFWATWCPPCHDQMMHLKEFDEWSSEGEGPVVLSINTDQPGGDRHAKVEGYLEQRGVPHPTLLDDGAVQADYRVDSFPTLVVVDPEGSISYAGSGVHPPGTMRDLVAEAAK